jgi:hypothetical protein
MDPLAFSKAGGAGPRSRRKSIRSWEKQKAIHERKLELYPDAPAAAKWRREIESLDRAIERQRRRLEHD